MMRVVVAGDIPLSLRFRDFSFPGQQRQFYCSYCLTLQVGLHLLGWAELPVSYVNHALSIDLSLHMYRMAMVSEMTWREPIDLKATRRVMSRASV